MSVRTKGHLPTRPRLIEIADELTRELIRAGFVVHRYEAYSSTSIYLKIDYGAGNSIRIADHKGAHWLRYRYNIGPNISAYHTDRADDNMLRIYYPLNEAPRLVADIMAARANLNPSVYEQRIAFGKQDRDDPSKKGFWKHDSTRRAMLDGNEIVYMDKHYDGEQIYVETEDGEICFADKHYDDEEIPS